jgi:hypothetical protein
VLPTLRKYMVEEPDEEVSGKVSPFATGEDHN